MGGSNDRSVGWVDRMIAQGGRIGQSVAPAFGDVARRAGVYIGGGVQAPRARAAGTPLRLLNWATRDHCVTSRSVLVEGHGKQGFIVRKPRAVETSAMPTGSFSEKDINTCRGTDVSGPSR